MRPQSLARLNATTTPFGDEFKDDSPKEVQRPSVTVPSAVTYAPTRYVYDSLGNLIEIEDAAGNSTLLARDRRA